MDVNEGGREGIEAARWLRDICQTAVVFVTSYNDDDTVERIHQQVPGAPVLAKPVYHKSLAGAVSAATKHCPIGRQNGWSSDPRCPGPLLQTKAVGAKNISLQGNSPRFVALCVKDKCALSGGLLLGYRWRWGFLIPYKSLQRSELSGSIHGSWATLPRPCRNHHTNAARLSTSRPIVSVPFLAHLEGDTCPRSPRRTNNLVQMSLGTPRLPTPCRMG